MVLMKVAAVGIQSTNHGPFVLLKDADEEVALLIGIGYFEATQISMKLEHQEPPRPMTHDLLKSVLDALGAKVSKVSVNRLVQNTFYAQITLETSEAVLAIDSRPSDAIALALRVEAPIYVAENVLDQVGIRVKGTGEGQKITPEQIEQAEDAPAIPKTSELGQKIGVLNLRLKQAVEQEDYEQAAVIRDEIRELERVLEGN
ncbi:MAG: bifunctional nuclease domain-containing protein [Candidatus Latescibacterota bacterium]